jgi:hypothetical protein
MARTFHPRLMYGAGITLNLSLPLAPWTPGTKGIGGTDESAAGVPEAFRIRRDHKITVSLLLRETEWPAYLQFLTHVMDTASTFEFWFDQTDASTRSVSTASTARSATP